MDVAKKRYLFETDEHRALREQVRRFAANAIAPNAHAWEEANEFPRELYQQSAEAGFLGTGYPEDIGGDGGAVILEDPALGPVISIGVHLYLTEA